MREDLELQEQVFSMFAKEEDNQRILKKHQQLKEEELVKILQLKVESVVCDIQAIIAKKKPFNKDVDYEKRRKQVIDQLVSNNRLVFFGDNANKLGESTLKNFLKVCYEHSQKRHLKNFNIEIILKIFRRWFFPGRQELISKHLRKVSPDFRLKQLTKKKKTMQKLKIEHDILLKRSQLMTIQEEIEQIEKEIAPNKKSKCKVEEEESEEEEEFTYPTIQQKSKPVSAPVYSIIQSQDKFSVSKNEKPKPNKEKPTIMSPTTPPRGSSSKQWTSQQQKYFIQLLSKTSVRNNQILMGLMQQQFGKNPKFNPESFRNKKATMFRSCKGRFLQAIKKKNLLSKIEYQQLKAHFQSINLLRSYKFVTFFMNRYYYIVFESQSDRVLRDIIDEVYKQPTRMKSTVKTSDQSPRMVILPSKHPRKMIIEQKDYP